MPDDELFSHTTTRTSYILMRRFRGPLCARPTLLVGYL